MSWLSSHQKSGKREVAIVQLLLFWTLVGFVSLNGFSTEGMEMVRLLVLYVFGFAGAAFGADWASKQTTFVKGDG